MEEDYSVKTGRSLPSLDEDLLVYILRGLIDLDLVKYNREKRAFDKRKGRSCEWPVQFVCIATNGVNIAVNEE